MLGTPCEILEKLRDRTLLLFQGVGDSHEDSSSHFREDVRDTQSQPLALHRGVLREPSSKALADSDTVQYSAESRLNVLLASSGYSDNIQFALDHQPSA